MTTDKLRRRVLLAMENSRFKWLRPTLTMSERHEIYKKALEIFRGYVSNYTLWDNPESLHGTCHALKEAMHEIGGKYLVHWNRYSLVDRYDVDVHEFLFPEIRRNKKFRTRYNTYWIPVEDYKTRIEWLERAIKNTEP